MRQQNRTERQFGLRFAQVEAILSPRDFPGQHVLDKDFEGIRASGGKLQAFKKTDVPGLQHVVLGAGGLELRGPAWRNAPARRKSGIRFAGSAARHCATTWYSSGESNSKPAGIA